MIIQLVRHLSYWLLHYCTLYHHFVKIYTTLHHSEQVDPPVYICACTCMYFTRSTSFIIVYKIRNHTKMYIYLIS